MEVQIPPSLLITLNARGWSVSDRNDSLLWPQTDLMPQNARLPADLTVSSEGSHIPKERGGRGVSHINPEVTSHPWLGEEGGPQGARSVSPGKYFPWGP